MTKPHADAAVACRLALGAVPDEEIKRACELLSDLDDFGATQARIIETLRVGLEQALLKAAVYLEEDIKPKQRKETTT